MKNGQFSMRDLYPNAGAVMTTMEVTAPELDEQVVLTTGADSPYPTMVTKNDKSNMIWAGLAVIALLVAFGVVK